MILGDGFALLEPSLSDCLFLDLLRFVKREHLTSITQGLYQPTFMEKNITNLTNHAMLMKTLTAGGMKAAAATITFAFTLLVTRILDPADAGLFFLGLTLLVVITVIFRLGLDNVVLREFGAHGASPLSRRILNTGLFYTLTASAVFSLLATVFSEPIASVIFNKPELAKVLRPFFIAIPFVAVFTLLSFAFQGLYKVFASILFQNLALLLTSGIIIGGLTLGGFTVNSEVAAWVVMAVAQGVCCLSLINWFFQPAVRVRSLKGPIPNILKASSNFWIASLMTLTTTWSGVLIVGVLLPSADVAAINAAQRTAQLISFALLVVNIVAAPRYAKLFANGDIDDIRHLSQLTSRLLICFVILPVIAVIYYSNNIMSVFGSDYRGSGVLLSILALGQFINVATGSVGYILNMCGFEKDFRNCTVFSGLITIVSVTWLTLQYGVLGAAIGTTLGLSVQNLLATYFVKKRLGFSSIL